MTFYILAAIIVSIILGYSQSKIKEVQPIL